jgi:hypothetical protein
MARFAGSVSLSVPNFGRSAQVKVDGWQGQMAGQTTAAGNAADAVSVGNLYGSLRKNAPDYSKITQVGLGNKSAEKLAGWNAAANMTAAGIDAAKSIAVAKNQAEVYNEQASAASKGGAMSAIGGIASAAIGLISDETTKHTIDQIDDALDTLRQLRPVTFFYKDEYSAQPERMHYGFLAQEYQTVMPDATYFDEAIGKMCIDTNELIALLVRANQQLESRVVRLEAKQALAAV